MGRSGWAAPAALNQWRNGFLEMGGFFLVVPPLKPPKKGSLHVVKCAFGSPFNPPKEQRYPWLIQKPHIWFPLKTTNKGGSIFSVGEGEPLKRPLGLTNLSPRRRRETERDAQKRMKSSTTTRASPWLMPPQPPPQKKKKTQKKKRSPRRGRRGVVPHTCPTNRKIQSRSAPNSLPRFAPSPIHTLFWGDR